MFYDSPGGNSKKSCSQAEKVVVGEELHTPVGTLPAITALPLCALCVYPYTALGSLGTLLGSVSKHLCRACLERVLLNSCTCGLRTQQCRFPSLYSCSQNQPLSMSCRNPRCGTKYLTITLPIAISLPSLGCNSPAITLVLISRNPNATKTSRGFNPTRSLNSGLALTSISRNFGTDLWASLVPWRWKHCRLAAYRPLQTPSPVWLAMQRLRPPRTVALVDSRRRNGRPCVRDLFRRTNRLSSGQPFACVQQRLDTIIAGLNPWGRAAALLTSFMLNSGGGHGAPSRARPCRK